MCSFLGMQQGANSRPWRTSGGWWATTWACPTPPTSSRTTSKELGTRSNKCSAGFLFPHFSGRTRCPWSWRRTWPRPWASTTMSWCTRHSCVSRAFFMINAWPNYGPRVACGLLSYFRGPWTFFQNEQFKFSKNSKRNCHILSQIAISKMTKKVRKIWSTWQKVWPRLL